MKNFVHVDEFGFVYRHVIGLEAPSPEWAEVGFDATIAVASPTRYRLVGGQLVDSGKPKLPPERHLRWTGEDWADLRTLEQTKADRWEKIKATRDSIEHGGFTWDGSTFDSDLASQNKIIGAVQLANVTGPNFTIDWTLANNSVRTLSAADMVEVGKTLGLHVSTQHAIARGLRQQIEAATTAQEVEAIAWP